MQQKININAPVSMILKGIKDYQNLLYRQIDIKPECYLPIFAYLNNYAKMLNPEEKEESTCVKAKTLVKCNNAQVVDAIEKSKKLLYKQTEIKPEVYLHIMFKLDEYSKLLQDQDAGTTEQPIEQLQKEPAQTIATKNENEFTKLKNFM